MDLSFLQQEYLWGVALWRLILVVLIILVEFFSRPFVQWLVRRVIQSRHAATTEWAADAIQLLPRPLSVLFHVAVWYLAGALLMLPEEPTNVRLFVMGGLLIAVAVACTAVLFRVIDIIGLAAKRMASGTATRLDDQLVPLARNLLKFLLAIAVGIVIVDAMGYSVTSFIASLGIGGLALALAAKDTVGNFFGSVALFADQPFVIGDLVEIAGTQGTIEEIGLRVTRVRQHDKSLATIPNQSFTTSTVVNYSRRPQRRIRHKVGLSYDTAPDQVEAFIAAVRTMLEGMEQLDPATVVVHLESLDDSSLGVIVQVFTVEATFSAFMEGQEAVLLGLLRLVEDQGLEIAFPSRTVYLEQGGTSHEHVLEN